MSLGELSAEKKKKHEQMYYPTCKVKSPEASGSGVVIHSKEWYKNDDEHETEVYTYVLTNHHVISDAIEIEERWDSKLQKETKQEICQPVSIQLFEYNNYSKAVGSHSYEGDILAYSHSDKNDVALLRLREKEEIVDHVAELYPYDHRNDLYMFDSVFAVGSALGFPVFQTPGEITNAGYEIDGQNYIGTNSPLSFGSSGGGLFKKDEGNYYLCALPARIAVEGWASVANHIGLCVPISAVYSFLEENHFEHIWRKKELDPEAEQEKRKEKIEKAKEN